MTATQETTAHTCKRCNGPARVTPWGSGAVAECENPKCGRNELLLMDVPAAPARAPRKPAHTPPRHAQDGVILEYGEYVGEHAPTPVQGKLEGIERGRARNRIRTLEEPNQRAVMSELCRAGFRVLQTSVRYKLQTCEHCGRKHRPQGGYGATPGVPDVLFCSDAWALPVWVGMEVKGSDTVLSDAQEVLRDARRIVVIRDPARALPIALKIHAALLALPAAQTPQIAPERPAPPPPW